MKKTLFFSMLMATVVNVSYASDFNAVSFLGTHCIIMLLTPQLILLLLPIRVHLQDHGVDIQNLREV